MDTKVPWKHACVTRSVRSTGPRRTTLGFPAEHRRRVAGEFSVPDLELTTGFLLAGVRAELTEGLHQMGTHETVSTAQKLAPRVVGPEGPLTRSVHDPWVPTVACHPALAHAGQERLSG